MRDSVKEQKRISGTPRLSLYGQLCVSVRGASGGEERCEQMACEGPSSGTNGASSAANRSGDERDGRFLRGAVTES